MGRNISARGGRAAAAALALALGSVVLAGCGFTPLYAEPGVVSRLGRIDVTTPSTRTGYLLRERLEDALAWERDAPTAYRLEVSLTEARFPRGRRIDDTAARYELRVDALYVLADAATGAEVLRGTTETHVSYASVTQPYAGIVSQQDAEERAAAYTAERIRSELAAHFAAGG